MKVLRRHDSRCHGAHLSRRGHAALSLALPPSQTADIYPQSPNLPNISSHSSWVLNYVYQRRWPRLVARSGLQRDGMANVQAFRPRFCEADSALPDPVTVHWTEHHDGGGVHIHDIRLSFVRVYCGELYGCFIFHNCQFLTVG